MNTSFDTVSQSPKQAFAGMPATRSIRHFDDPDESFDLAPRRQQREPGEDVKRTEDGRELNSHGRLVATVETEGGKRVRVPGAGAYPGEPPYGAPLSGFHGKATDIFDAFAYVPSNQPTSERPIGFFSVVGLAGQDSAKCDNPAWTLLGRMKPEVYKQVQEELGDLKNDAFKPVILVNGMRAENMTMFSISQPHQMFGSSIWLAAAPIEILNHPVPVIDAAKIESIVAAGRALQHIEKMKSNQMIMQTEQLSLRF